MPRALRALCSSLPPGTAVAVESDNTPTVALVARLAVRRPAMLTPLKELLDAVQQTGIVLAVPRHIPGVRNVLSDQASRRWLAGRASMEWPLASKVFARLVLETPFALEVDLFATARNRKLRNFYSFLPEAEAVGTDALAHCWTRWAGVYANPPFALMSRVLRKIADQRVPALIIAPVWPSAAWWPMARGMCYQAQLLPVSAAVVDSRTVPEPLKRATWRLAALWFHPSRRADPTVLDKLAHLSRASWLR